MGERLLKVAILIVQWLILPKPLGSSSSFYLLSPAAAAAAATPKARLKTVLQPLILRYYSLLPFPYYYLSLVPAGYLIYYHCHYLYTSILFISLSLYLSIYLSVYLSILSISPPIIDLIDYCPSPS